MVKIDKVGYKFITNEGYEAEIVEYFSARNCTFEIKCNGYRSYNREFKHALLGNFKNPFHKSVYGVGYFGIGLRGASASRCYRTWFNMMHRCYSKNFHKDNPAYIDCSVTYEWHNFQTFAKWFYENYNSEIMEDWQLDKDILQRENKVYSPETCCFVPQEINKLFSGHTSKSIHPAGVTIHKNTQKFSPQLWKNGKRLYLGLYNTAEEASDIYKCAKETHIKEVANKWKEFIAKNVYEAIINLK